MNEPLRLEFNEWARAGKGASMELGHRPVGERAIERGSGLLSELGAVATGFGRY